MHTHTHTHTHTQTHKPNTMHVAVCVCGPEGHYHLFDIIKNIVLLLWKLLEVKFHCVCVIAVQVHAGKWSDGSNIIHREASVCTEQIFYFIGWKVTRKSFIETMFLQRKKG